MAKKIAVVWASKGGLGDVGKFAASHAALRGSAVELTAVALSEDGAATGVESTEVFPATRAEKLQETLKDVEIKKVNIKSEDAEESLATIFSGVDAVIACPGSRQSGIATTCTIGARKIVAAMKKAKVERLVVLSSFGIGDDYMPSSVLKFFWGFLLRVVWPTMRRDVEGMEKIVKESGLEYLIVRPMGVDPKELPVGSYAILTARGQGSLPLTVAKDDVGLFLLEEAVAPKHTKTGVTIGKDKTATVV
ncbi:unnamed protein product [Durusdinium trenchii]|uniref:NAD(P)-binding domain-containing protein n=1 Tax=Durusdinium trenchii TaxID=1381693 RepID=A0ABP0Q8W3_9DINO